MELLHMFSLIGLLLGKQFLEYLLALRNCFLLHEPKGIGITSRGSNTIVICDQNSSLLKVIETVVAIRPRAAYCLHLADLVCVVLIHRKSVKAILIGLALKFVKDG